MKLRCFPHCFIKSCFCDILLKNIESNLHWCLHNCLHQSTPVGVPESMNPILFIPFMSSVFFCLQGLKISWALQKLQNLKVQNSNSPKASFSEMKWSMRNFRSKWRLYSIGVFMITHVHKGGKTRLNWNFQLV